MRLKVRFSGMADARRPIVLVDGNPAVRDAKGANGDFLLDTTGYPDGPHDLSVGLSNGEAIIPEADSQTVVMDNTPPNVVRAEQYGDLEAGESTGLRVTAEDQGSGVAEVQLLLPDRTVVMSPDPDGVLQTDLGQLSAPVAYRIQVRDNAGNTALWPDSGFAELAAQNLPVPTGLDGVAQDDRSVALTWSAAVLPEGGSYVVFRSDDSGLPELIGHSVEPWFVDVGAEPGKSHLYTVAVQTREGCTGKSSPALKVSVPLDAPAVAWASQKLAFTGDSGSIGPINATASSGPTTISGTITSNTTWDLAGSPYLVAGSVTVGTGVTLTIAPGVIVKFASATYLKVNGTIQAQGTIDNPIIFTSATDDLHGGDTNGDSTATAPLAGDWNNIEAAPGGVVYLSDAQVLYAGRSTAAVYSSGGAVQADAISVANSSSRGVQLVGGSLQDSTISGIATASVYVTSGSPVINGNNLSGGNYGVYVYGGAPAITNNRITGAATAGVYFYGYGADVTGALTGNQISASQGYAVDISLSGRAIGNLTAASNTFTGTQYNGYGLSGTFGGTNTLPLLDFPYLPHSVAVGSAASLTVPAGAVFKVVSGSFTNNGTLSLNGTAAASITYTGIKDDSIGGDSNGDGSATTPAQGDWGALILAAGHVSATYATFRYGGGSYVQVDHRAGVAALSDLTITDAKDTGFQLRDGATVTRAAVQRVAMGVRALSGSPVIQDSTILAANTGVYVSGGSPTIRNNLLTDSPYGVYVYSYSTLAQPIISENQISRNTVGVYTYNRAPVLSGLTLTGNTFTGNSYPVQFNADSSGYGSNVITSNVFSGNLHGGYRLSGRVTVSSALYPLDAPYLVTSSLTVQGVTLVMNPAVTVKLTDGITVSGPGGTLDVRGTADQPVTLTSEKDDSVGGDTNNDGTATQPAGGDWTDLTFSSGARGVLDHAQVIYGGNVSLQYPLLYASSSDLQVTNSDLGYSGADGVYLTGNGTGSSLIQGTTVHDTPRRGLSLASNTSLSVVSSDVYRNGTGLYTSFSGPYVESSTIRDNQTGLSNLCNPCSASPKVRLTSFLNNGKSVDNYTAATPVDVRYNWWGSEAGPPAGGFANGTNGPVAVLPWVGHEYTDARLFGNAWWTGYIRSVNLISGDFTRSATDLSIPIGKGFPITVSRTYHSLSWTNGSLGYRWTFNLDLGLLDEPDQNRVTVIYGSGQQARFTANPDGTYTPPSGERNHLVRQADGTWELTTKDHNRFTFDAQGKAVAAVDPNGNFLSFSYGADGKLASVTDAGDRTVAFTRDEAGRVTDVTDPAQRTVHYAYDADGNLTSVTDVMGQTTTYAYDSDRLLLSSTGPDSVVQFRVDYDGNTRVATVTDALGKVTTYRYDPPNRKTQVTDPRGYTTSTIYDAQLRLLSLTDPLGYTETRSYDANNNVISVQDKSGGISSYSYDGHDNLTTATDPLGKATTFAYDPVSDDLLSVTDPLGAETQYVYDSRHNRIQETDPIGALRQVAVDAAGLATQITDPLGHVTTVDYDAYGNATRVVDPSGHSTGSLYDLLSRQTQVTDAPGQVTHFDYDAAGRLMTTTNPLGGVTQHAFDDYGRLTRTTDAEGHVTATTYDAAGHVLVETDALNHTKQYTYDAAGNRSSMTDELGNVTQFTYDARNNLKTVTDPLDHVTTYDYDANGNQSAVTNPNNATTRNTYDAANRLVRVTAPDGETWMSREYDALGRVVAETDGNGHTTRFQIDPAGRVTGTTDPLGKTTTDTYDLVGNRLSRTDALVHTTQYDYDALGHLASVTQPSGDQYQYSYDAVGRLTDVTDPNLHTTTRVYDALGRVVEERDPSGAVTAFAYDKVGNLVRLTDRAGAVTTYTYDALNRLTEVAAPGAVTLSYAFDAAGHRTSMTDSTGTTAFTYDLAGRLTGVTAPDQRSLGYTYDPAGNVTEISDYAGQHVTRTFDQRNRLTQVTTPDGAATAYTYDGADKWLTRTYPGGFQAEATYDAVNHLLGLTNRRSDGTVLSSFAYTYDDLGRQMSVQDDLGVTQYGYDVNSRLTRVTEPDGTVTDYTYDGAGNRLSKSVTPTGSSAEVTSYAYDTVDRLTQIQNPDGSTTAYSFDANGNLTGDGVRSYTYDGLNRLVSVAEGTNNLAAYSYNANGLRTQKVTPTGTVNYYYDGDKVVNEGDGTAITATNVWGLSPIRRETGGQVGYYVFNGHGDVVGVEDGSTTPLATYRYDAFGAPVAVTGSFDSPLGYNGEPYDAETGLLYLRARFYNPVLGRFLTQDTYKGDPWQPWTQNLYSYVGNNPINYVDPTGHYASCTADAEARGECTMASAYSTYDDGNDPGRTKVIQGWGDSAGNEWVMYDDYSIEQVKFSEQGTQADVPNLNYQYVVTGDLSLLDYPDPRLPDFYVVNGSMPGVGSGGFLFDKNGHVYFSPAPGIDLETSGMGLACWMTTDDDPQALIGGDGQFGYGSMLFMTVGVMNSGDLDAICLGLNSAEYDAGYGIGHTYQLR